MCVCVPGYVSKSVCVKVWIHVCVCVGGCECESVRRCRREKKHGKFSLNDYLKPQTKSCEFI